MSRRRAAGRVVPDLAEMARLEACPEKSPDFGLAPVTLRALGQREEHGIAERDGLLLGYLVVPGGRDQPLLELGAR
jgi:hypothetical protein